MSKQIKFYHANAKGTGSALQITAVDGGIDIVIYPQKPLHRSDALPTFDGGMAFVTKLEAVAIAQVIEVFRGCSESINDGFGILYKDGDSGIVLRMSHVIEPVPGYVLTLTKDDGSHVSFFMNQHEATALCAAIEGVLAGLLV